jgi:bifunctional DNA-binding transcriptional regulator/antitoxin component of YhaV-PrlF toxin-antitoxin module
MISKVKGKKKVSPPKTRAGRTSTSRISSKNQVTIPVDILRAVGLQAGDDVEFAMNDAGFIEARKVEEKNLFLELSRVAGDTYRGFNLEEERKLNWD